MGDEFYERPPEKNARYARTLARNSSEEITKFEKLYVAAMEKNDRGKYEESNCLRESLVTLQRDLEAEIDTIPPGCQGELVRVMRRLDATLESCRTFPPPLLNSPDARAALEVRTARTAASDHADRRARELAQPVRGVNVVNSDIGFNPRRKTDSSVVTTSSSSEESFKSTSDENPLEGASGVAQPETATEVGADDEQHHRSVSEAGAKRKSGATKSRSKTRYKDAPPDMRMGAKSVELKKKQSDKNPAESEVSSTLSEEPGLAGSQRDIFGEKFQKYVAKLLSCGAKVQDKIAKGQDLSDTDIDLFSIVVDKDDKHVWGRSVVGVESESTSNFEKYRLGQITATDKHSFRRVETEAELEPSPRRGEAAAAAPKNTRAESHPASWRMTNWSLAGFDKNFDAVLRPETPPFVPIPTLPTVFPGAAASAPTYATTATSHPASVPVHSTTTRTTPHRSAPVKTAAAPEEPASSSSKPAPSSSKPAPSPSAPAATPAAPKHSPAVPPPPAAPTHSPAAPAPPAASTHSPAAPPPPAAPTHFPAAPTLPPAASMHLPAAPAAYPIYPVSEDSRDEVNRQIMVTGLERECRKTVASLRPPEKKKFNGDTEKHDYETVKKGFERAMNQPGITDEIKITELSHWFSGVALGYIELHNLEEDPATQLELIWYELNGQYGKKTNSVDNLLQKIIDGPEVKSGDQKAINLFTIELKKFDIIATKTDRRKILDSADTINRIIRDRMPSAVPRWAKKIDHALDRDEDDDTASSFKKFIKFVTRESSYAETLKVIKGRPDAKKTQTGAKTINALVKPSKTTGAKGKQPSKTKKSTVNAANVEKSGGGGGGGGGGNKSSGGKSNHNFPKGSFGKKPTNTSNVKPPPIQPQRQPYQNKKSFKEANQHTTTAWRCEHCQGTSFHTLDTCNSFIRADINKKYNMIRKTGNCYRCFSTDHIAADCEIEEIRCSKCGKTHHTLLHRDQKQQ